MVYIKFVLHEPINVHGRQGMESTSSGKRRQLREPLVIYMKYYLQELPFGHLHEVLSTGTTLVSFLFQ